MKKIVLIMVAFSLVFACQLFAAGYDMPSSSQPGMKSDQATTGAAPSQMDKMTRASKIIGKSVKNPQGEDLGKIEDIVIDRSSNRISYVVLESGGVLGMGEKYFAVPWQAFKVSPTEDTLTLNIDKDKLKNAPSFTKNNWPDMTNRQWGTDVYRYYGVQPYWQSR